MTASLAVPLSDTLHLGVGRHILLSRQILCLGCERTDFPLWEKVIEGAVSRDPWSDLPQYLLVMGLDEGRRCFQQQD